MNFLIFVFLVIIVATIKPSEVGVNDWTLHNVGQLQQITFTKSKIYFLSSLGSIGIINKQTGTVEDRSFKQQTQSIISLQEMQMKIGTKLNQILTYYMSQKGVTQKVDDRFTYQKKKILSIAQTKLQQFYLTISNLYTGEQIIRQATQKQQFIQIISKDDVLYLLAIKHNENLYCIQKMELKSFQQKYCFQSFGISQIKIKIIDNYLLLTTQSKSLLLDLSLQLIQLFYDRFLYSINRTLVFQNSAHQILSKQPVLSRPIFTSKKQNLAYIRQNSQFIIVEQDGYQIIKISHPRKSKILRAWLNYKAINTYQLLVQFSDLQLTCFLISKNQMQKMWTRQQSLGYVDHVLFKKYDELDTLDNEYHRQIISHSHRNLSLIQKISKIPTDFMRRINQQISDIMRTCSQSIHSIKQLINIDGSSIRKFKMSQSQEIKYGLRKYIIFITKYNTIIALDSKTKAVIWKINQQMGKDSKHLALVHLKQDYQTQLAILVTYHHHNRQVQISQITKQGSLQILKIYQFEGQPQIFKLNQHSLAIKINNKLQKFHLFQQDDLPQKQLYFYTQKQHQIIGYKAIGDQVGRIWNFRTSANQKILKVASAFRGDQTAHIPLFDNEKVFFKNVDFTNIAVLTSHNLTSIALYIINGRTGKVQYNSFKNNPNTGLPINLVYDQNNVLVSYFNTKNSVYQIWTVEQYQERLQRSAINMISSYLKNQHYRPEQDRERTVFEQQVYASPVPIKVMAVSQSKMSLTRRNLFIITRQNKLYTIPRDLVSTRRPKKDVKGVFSNQKFIQYNYLLPFGANLYLSYYIQLSHLQNIQFNPTDMQSTIFTLCYGHDIFLIRNSPDKTFDMITEDFNHTVLLIILAVVTVGLIFFKSVLTKAKLKKPHLQ